MECVVVLRMMTQLIRFLAMIKLIWLHPQRQR